MGKLSPDRFKQPFYRPYPTLIVPISVGRGLHIPRASASREALATGVPRLHRQLPRPKSATLSPFSRRRGGSERHITTPRQGDSQRRRARSTLDPYGKEKTTLEHTT